MNCVAHSRKDKYHSKMQSRNYLFLPHARHGNRALKLRNWKQWRAVLATTGKSTWVPAALAAFCSVEARCKANSRVDVVLFRRDCSVDRAPFRGTHGNGRAAVGLGHPGGMVAHQVELKIFGKL